MHSFATLFNELHTQQLDRRKGKHGWWNNTNRCTVAGKVFVGFIHITMEGQCINSHKHFESFYQNFIFHKLKFQHDFSQIST